MMDDGWERGTVIDPLPIQLILRLLSMLTFSSETTEVNRACDQGTYNLYQ